jgi:hypothetical protein
MGRVIGRARKKDAVTALKAFVETYQVKYEQSGQLAWNDMVPPCRLFCGKRDVVGALGRQASSLGRKKG